MAMGVELLRDAKSSGFLVSKTTRSFLSSRMMIQFESRLRIIFLICGNSLWVRAATLGLIDPESTRSRFLAIVAQFPPDDADSCGEIRAGES